MAILPILFITMGNLENKLTFAPLKFIFTLFSLPTTAMIMSVFIATWFLGIRRKIKLEVIMQWLIKGMEGIFSILLIIAAGGAFKEVLVITGVADTLTNMAGAWSLHPLLFGWMLAAIIRVAIGSATVAALTAAGLLAPGMVQMNVSPELMVLSIGSGSIFFPTSTTPASGCSKNFSTYHQRDLSVLDPDGKLYFIDGLGWCVDHLYVCSMKKMN